MLLKRHASQGVFLALSLPLGMFWFVVLLTLSLFGLSLVPALLGIPILALTALVWTGAARLERRRVRALLGTDIPRPYRQPLRRTVFSRVRALILDPALWRDLIYVLLLLPIGIVEFVVFVVAFALPALLLAYPLWFYNPTLLESLLAVLAGLLTTAVGVSLVRMSAQAHVAIVRSLLGTSPLRFLRPTRRATRRAALVGASILLTILLATALLVEWPSLDWRELWETVTSTERIHALFQSFGVWAPAVFTLLQAAQVVIAAVPAAPIMLAGVAAFGPWWGLFLSLFGAVAGSVVAFLLGRRFGRPMVVRLVSEKVLDKYARKMGADGWWRLGALMLPLPVGGDVVCSLAGLSEITLRRFVILNVIGRIPLTTVAILTASGLAAGSIGLLATAGVVLMVLALVAFLYVRREKHREKSSSGSPK